ncbi:hypothetical protein [Corallococcus aberystwythensis]|uniref:Uncharacterized protein n=1 Tax=Corallococcus aberystwythensis TaxID=2316722 RepID=A0A3A8Q3G8_9BACT|nr:hypothetical protein [Corallococcus aberystwythensis]RKH57864.1 hypothetical protein D7W81_30215 [Corallococcus aberystwythensis]
MSKVSAGRTPSLLPCDVRRDGDRLFDVAMWCLGQDVRCPDGNVLLRHGLVREPRPPGVEGQSAYQGQLPDGGRLTLWGFGALCDACGGAIFVPRDGFVPRWVEGACGQAFRVEDVGVRRDAATGPERRAARAGLALLADWLAEYEAWVARDVGLAWRRECLAARRKASPIPAQELSTAWRRLAVRVRATDASVQHHVAPMTGA